MPKVAKPKAAATVCGGSVAIPKARMCATPGCELREWHDGPHSNAIVGGERRSKSAPEDSKEQDLAAWQERIDAATDRIEAALLTLLGKHLGAAAALKVDTDASSTGGASDDWTTSGRLAGWRAIFNLGRVSGDPEGVQRGQKMNSKDRSIKYIAPSGRRFATRQQVASHFDLDVVEKEEEPPSPPQPKKPVKEPPPVQTDAGLAFEVDRILDVRDAKKGREFLVRWVGYGADDDTWEPEAGFIDLDPIRAFEAQRPSLLRRDSIWRRAQQLGPEHQAELPAWRGSQPAAVGRRHPDAAEDRAVRVSEADQAAEAARQTEALLTAASFGPMSPLCYVAPAERADLGLFARTAIPTGTRICEYAGPVLPGEWQQQGGYNLGIPGGPGGVGAAGCVGGVDSSFFIDGNSQQAPFKDEGRSLGTYANHSRAANAGYRWHVAGKKAPHALAGALSIVALEPIPANAEIRVDYEAEGRQGQYWSALGMTPHEGEWKSVRLPALPPGALGLEDEEAEARAQAAAAAPSATEEAEARAQAAAAASSATAAAPQPQPALLLASVAQAQLPWGGPSGGDARLRTLVPRLAPYCTGGERWQLGATAKSTAPLFGVVATHLPGRSALECYMRWCQLARDEEQERERGGGGGGGEEGAEGEPAVLLPEAALPEAGGCFCGTKRHLTGSGLDFCGVWLDCQACGRRVHGDCAGWEQEPPEAVATAYRCPDCPADAPRSEAALKRLKQKTVPVVLALLPRHKLALQEKIEAEYQGPNPRYVGKWFRGWVAVAHDDGTCDVHYDDGDEEARVPRERIKAFVNGEVAERAAARDAVLASRQAAKDAAAAERVAKRAAIAAERAAVRDAAAAERAAERAAAREAVKAMSEAERMAVRKWRLLSALPGKQLPEGERVQGKYQGALGGVNWFAGVVTAARDDGTYDLLYDDGDTEEEVEPRFIRVEATQGDYYAAKRAASATEDDPSEADQDGATEPAEPIPPQPVPAARPAEEPAEEAAEEEPTAVSRQRGRRARDTPAPVPEPKRQRSSESEAGSMVEMGPKRLRSSSSSSSSEAGSMVEMERSPARRVLSATVRVSPDGPGAAARAATTRQRLASFHADSCSLS